MPVIKFYIFIFTVVANDAPKQLDFSGTNTIFIQEDQPISKSTFF